MILYVNNKTLAGKVASTRPYTAGQVVITTTKKRPLEKKY